MKILLFFHYRLDDLGAGKINFLNRLDQYVNELNRLDSSVIFQFHYWSSAPLDFPVNFDVVYHKKSNIIFSFWEISHNLKETIKNSDQIGIVVGDNYFSFWLAEFLKFKNRNIKIQGSFHGSISATETKSKIKRVFKRLLIYLSVRKLNQIRVVNEQQFDEIKKISKKHKKYDIRILPIPVQIPEISQNFEMQSLGFVGRFHTERGLIEWTEIAKLSYESNLINKIVIVGEGAESSTFLRQLASIDGLSILKLGFVPNSEMSSVYSEIRVLLSTAQTETYGLALREAIAAGCFVVAKSNPTTEALAKNSNDLMRTYHDTSEAKSCIEYFLNSKSEHNQEVLNFRLKLQKESSENLHKLASSWLDLFL